MKKSELQKMIREEIQRARTLSEANVPKVGDAVKIGVGHAHGGEVGLINIVDLKKHATAYVELKNFARVIPVPIEDMVWNDSKNMWIEKVKP